MRPALSRLPASGAGGPLAIPGGEDLIARRGDDRGSFTSPLYEKTPPSRPGDTREPATLPRMPVNAEVAELDRDALNAARVAELCRAAAGERLITIRRALGMKNWRTWLNHECPITKPVVGECIKAAQKRVDMARCEAGRDRGP